jgi:hypothetical protein
MKARTNVKAGTNCPANDLEEVLGVGYWTGKCKD